MAGQRTRGRSTVRRIGVIGLGSIGLRMLNAIAHHPDFDAVSAWDPATAACTRARAAHSGTVIADTADEVIRSPTVDLVYIACPPQHHREHALAVIDAGKPILCEKPLGVNLDDSRDLVRRVERSALPNAVNLLHASSRASHDLQVAMDAGDLGRVVWVDIHLHLPKWAARRYAEAPWLAERTEGGFIREVTTHYVFLCQRLFGALTLRDAQIDFPASAMHAEHFADVRLDANGVPITITGTTLGAGPEINHATFWGEKASWRIRDLHTLQIAADDRWLSAGPAHDSPELDTYLRQLDSLAALLDGRAHTLPDFRAAFATQELIEAILAR